MTRAALHLTAPTQTERGLLRLAERITAFVEGRVAARAARREIALDLLREQQARKHDQRGIDHMLAQAGLPRR